MERRHDQNFASAVEFHHSLISFMAIMLCIYRYRRRLTQRPRRFRVRPWLRRREQQGLYSNLFQELALGEPDTVDYFRFIRMEPAMFNEVLNKVRPLLERSRRSRRALDPGIKLTIALRFYATGDAYRDMAYSFRVAHNTISVLVREVNDAIIQAYGDQVILPNEEESWRQKGNQFGDRWNTPHAIGALDGKHIAIRCPRGSGSRFYNFKGFYSIVLLALVDAEQKFMWVDVGANGSCSDAGLFKETQLYKDFEAGKMRLPTTDSLPNDDRPFPYFILGDNAFALKSWMMTPYSHRNKTHEELIYNYRHSRGRRVVECTFGIFAQRYRCFLKTLEVSHKTARRITLACVCQHNLHRTRYPQSNIDQQEDMSQLLPVAWRDDNLTQELSSVTGGTSVSRLARQQRVYLKTYFMKANPVDWQDDMLLPRY